MSPFKKNDNQTMFPSLLPASIPLSLSLFLSLQRINIYLFFLSSATRARSLVFYPLFFMSFLSRLSGCCVSAFQTAVISSFTVFTERGHVEHDMSNTKHGAVFHHCAGTRQKCRQWTEHMYCIFISLLLCFNINMKTER